jgi:hypothetical protein
MANQRMYLKCRGCGEKILLSKHMVADPISCWFISDDIGEILNDFVDKHNYCCITNNVHEYHQFELEYEMSFEDDRDLKIKKGYVIEK